ncbi:MAG: hypothetical protein H0Z29_04470 [Candidatus Marinimicrobia bacterium]|nr:hypothetical protein [Candidatus Neomarinimicrobiota bacterium]
MTQEGDTITGVTKVPKDFDITMNDNLKISWDSREGTQAYSLIVSQKEESGDWLPVIDETLYVNFYIINSEVIETDDSIRVEVVAFDENYYNYVVKEMDASGVVGAYGVFGSAVRKERSFLISDFK